MPCKHALRRIGPWSAIVAALLASHLGAAEQVLLDEYWAPEILLNEVTAAEIDVQATGNPEDAHSGEVAAVLTNRTGWPNLRFRAAGMVTLTEVAPAASEARLWYRTDAWDGRWRLEIWIHVDGLTPAPVKALEATLDGGGEAGRLLADGHWHQARGPLAPTGSYAALPKQRPLTTYVWLVPLEGWGKAHRTLIDRCEIGSPGAPPGTAPAPARRVRPHPGRQTAGPGWVWWEAEDATRHDFPAGGAYAPFTPEQQEKLSEGAWLQWHDCTGHSAAWSITLAEAGTYAFWMRSAVPDGPLQLRWDGKDWRVFRPGDVEPLDRVLIHDRGEWKLEASWVRIGDVTLAAGRHTFDLVGLPDAGGAAFDCWLLTSRPFVPHGLSKPAAP